MARTRETVCGHTDRPVPFPVAVHGSSINGGPDVSARTVERDSLDTG